MRGNRFCVQYGAIRGPEKKWSNEDTTHYADVGPPALLKSLQQFVSSKVNRVKDYKANGVVVATDRLFTDVNTALELLTHGVSVVGTINFGPSFGFPDILMQYKKKLKKRGSFAQAVYVDDPRLRFYLWKDSKVLGILSTNCDMISCSEVERWVKKYKKGVRFPSQRKSVPCPPAAKTFNGKMNGVDKHNQIQLQNYSIQKSMTLERWPKQAFLGYLDTMLTNMYTVARQINADVSHGAFMKNIAEALVSDSSYHRRRELRVPQHVPERTPTRSSSGKKYHSVRCAMCCMEHKRHETSIRCATCKPSADTGCHNVPLCNKIHGDSKETCFDRWHHLKHHERIMVSNKNVKIAFE